MKNNLSKIIKECFWDYNITEDDINKILSSDNDFDKKFLFQKILENSSNILRDLQIFDKDDLKLLLEQYKVSKFNYDYFFKRKNIAEYFFFEKELKVEELKWVK